MAHAGNDRQLGTADGTGRGLAAGGANQRVSTAMDHRGWALDLFQGFGQRTGGHDGQELVADATRVDASRPGRPIHGGQLILALRQGAAQLGHHLQTKRHELLFCFHFHPRRHQGFQRRRFRRRQ